MRTMIIAAAFVALAASARADDACFRPLCTGAEPIYTGADGVSRGVPYGVCQTNTHAPEAIAHSLVPCGPGMTLVPHSGMCHVDACDGGGKGSCTFVGVCSTTPGFPTYGGDSPSPSGLMATCNADPTGLNYRSHTPASCPAGFSLVPNTGVCRRCASMPVMLRPDLVIRATWLRVGASVLPALAVHRGSAYGACFKVTNMGGAPSGPFRVAGGGLGIPFVPFVDLPGLAPGLAHSACIAYPTTPPVGIYRLELTVDSLGAVAETHEDNNNAVVTVKVIP